MALCFSAPFTTKIAKMKCIPIKWLCCLGITVPFFIFPKLNSGIGHIGVLREIILHGKQSYCPIENIRDKFNSVHFNGSYINNATNKSTVNSWYPAIPTDKVNFEDMCNTGVDIDLLIVIASSTSAKSGKRRQLARTTWLNMPVKSGNVKYVFILGQPTNAWENEVIIKEAIRFNDVLILNFKDTYRNLTLKTMSTMKWIASNCNRVKLIMKTDVDVFINVPRILNYLKGIKFSLPNTLLGRCYTYPPVERNSSYKYFVPMSEYSLQYFPPYCSGSGYVMSLATLKNLLRISYFVPKISIEDVYVGACAHCLRLRQQSHDDFGREFKEVTEDVQEPKDIFSYMTIHRVPYDIISYLWSV